MGKGRGFTGLGLIAALLGIGLLVAAPSAQADVFSLTSDHCTGGCGTGNTVFGTVTLLQSGTSVNVTVSLNDSFQFLQTGAGGGNYFDFNASPGVALGDITVTSPNTGVAVGGPIGTSGTNGSIHADGGGDYDFGIHCDTCGTGGNNILPVGTNITFTVANATIADLVFANPDNQIFVADIFSSLTGNTGIVDVSGTAPPPPVPEPASTALLGLSLAGIALGAALRRKKA